MGGGPANRDSEEKLRGKERERKGEGEKEIYSRDPRLELRGFGSCEA